MTRGSDFSVSSVQRRRLLAGDYRPLTFKGVLEPDNPKERLPYGCEPGAHYVLAWEHWPKRPVLYLTVTEVSGGPRKPRELFDRPWLVRFSVTDVRDSDVFLRPGGGDSSVDLLRAGAKPPSVWLDVQAKAISEFDHQRRLARHAEKMRERSKRHTRRKRAA